MPTICDEMRYNLAESRIVKMWELFAAISYRVETIAEFNEFCASDTSYFKAQIHKWLGTIEMTPESEHSLCIEPRGFLPSYKDQFEFKIELRIFNDYSVFIETDWHIY